MKRIFTLLGSLLLLLGVKAQAPVVKKETTKPSATTVTTPAATNAPAFKNVKSTPDLKVKSTPDLKVKSSEALKVKAAVTPTTAPSVKALKH